MSELRVDNIVDMGGSGAPKLRKGANVTGISTITQAVVGNATINAGGINATGIVTSSSNKFVGDLASGNITAGVMTATSSIVGSNITINSGGVNASGIVSATSYQGDGSNLTGVGLSIAPLSYNPDVSDLLVTLGTGIGITFNQRISAGVGTITLSLASAGSTVAEVFGLGNTTETTYTVTVQSTDSGNKYLLDGNQQYTPVLYPGGVYTFDQSHSSNSNHPLRFSITDNGTHGGGSEYTTGVETNGTPGSSGAYTRITISTSTPSPLYYYCTNHSAMGANITVGAVVQFNNDADPPNITITPKNDLSGNTVYAISYPSGAFTQSGAGGSFVGTAYTFATEKNPYGQLWTWGNNQYGILGQNSEVQYSSPVQIPGINWKTLVTGGGDNAYRAAAIKVDGTLWNWGRNSNGELGVNNRTHYSSPVQIPGTTWKHISSRGAVIATKTDNTLWSWGSNWQGALGQNGAGSADKSSPTQIPGTTWSTSNKHSISNGAGTCLAIKTDGTLWAWGGNNEGQLGQNEPGSLDRSSPVQVGDDTTWAAVSAFTYANIATKTDGTLWSWGLNQNGQLGQNDRTHYSSPTQVGTDTTWGILNTSCSRYGVAAIKTDGTLWQWGKSTNGGMGIGNNASRSSPTQVPGTTWKEVGIGDDGSRIAVKTDGTLWTWGDNAQGQGGQNNETEYNSPVQVPGIDWFSVSARRLVSMAIKQI